MKFSDHLDEANFVKDIKRGEVVRKEDFDEKDLPAFARNRGVTTTTKVISKDEDFDPDDVEVAAYKRVAADKGKSIEDEAQKGRLEFKKPLAPGEVTPQEAERQKRSERQKYLQKMRMPYREEDIISDEGGEKTQSDLMKDLESIVRRIKNK